MKPIDYPPPVRTLILHLKRLPGIGSKSAERMAVWLLDGGRAGLADFARALEEVETSVTSCADCGFFATAAGCAICDDSDRDSGLLCIVEQPTDVMPIERTGIYQGRYHTLGGRLSPLDNVGPEDLRLAALDRRLDSGQFREIILALGSDVPGEATSNFIAESLRHRGVSISKLAQGMPVGGGLDTADTLTLHRAFENRSGVLSL